MGGALDEAAQEGEDDDEGEVPQSIPPRRARASKRPVEHPAGRRTRPRLEIARRARGLSTRAAAAGGMGAGIQAEQAADDGDFSDWSD